MYNDEQPKRPADVVGERVKEVRKRRNWTFAELASRCAQAGATELSTQTLSNLENGRRGKDGTRRREITVDELVILAWVLSVAPIYLLTPVTAQGSRWSIDGYRVTPNTMLSPLSSVHRWVRAEGAGPPADSFDPHIWATEQPTTQPEAEDVVTYLQSKQPQGGDRAE